MSIQLLRTSSSRLVQSLQDIINVDLRQIGLTLVVRGLQKGGKPRSDRLTNESTAKRNTCMTGCDAYAFGYCILKLDGGERRALKI